MPRDTKTVLGWDGLSARSQVRSSPSFEGVPAPHHLVSGALPPQLTILPRRTRASEPPPRAEGSRPRIQAPQYRESPGTGQGSMAVGPALAIFDPYAEQVLAYTKAGDPTIPDLPLAEGYEPNVSKAVRILQFVLLSSVALMIWYMVSMLQAGD
jgi:hypothetical protein